MSTPNKYQPATNTMPEQTLMPPKCPYCGEEMPGIRVHQWIAKGFLIMAAFCPNDECRKAFNFEMFPTAGEPSRIASPH